jgi:hypothetical protein
MPYVEDKEGGCHYRGAALADLPRSARNELYELVQDTYNCMAD